MADTILIEYKAGYAQLQADSKAIQNELRTTEKVGVTAADNTTKSFAKTTDASKSLKSELRELKAQLAVATDPKEIERLAKAAGKLADQIDDATDAARVFASESKFEQVGNAIGSVGSKLRNLDFKGAADQSKLLLSATKGITFKEALGGVKDLGSTLLNVGKSLLLNPIFLLGGAIIAIVANFDKLKNSGGIVGKVFSTIGDILSGVVKGLETLANLIGLIDSESQAVYERQKKNLDDLAEAHAKTSDRIIKILKAQGKETSQLEARRIAEQGNILEKQYQLFRDNLLRQGKTLDDLSEEELQTLKDFGNKKADLLADEAAIIFAANEKKKAADKKLSDDLIAEANRLAKVLRDLQTGNIQLEYERRRQIILNNFDDEAAKYKGHHDILKELEIKKNNELNALFLENENKKRKILEDSQRDYVKIFADGAKDIAGEDTKLADHVIKNREDIIAAEKRALEIRKQLQAEFYNFLNSTVSAAQEINSNISQTQIDEANEKSTAEIEALQNQYDQGIISKEEFEKRKQAIDKRTQEEEARIKKRAFETNKQLALIQVAISSAQAIAKTASELGYPAALPFIALAVANAALQVAAIESQPTPKFAKGVVDLKGKGTGTSDSIHAMLSKGESVITAEATSQYSGLLKAMNKKQAGKFINEYYIAPALKAQRKRFEEKKDRSFAESLMKSVSLNGKFNDENLLDSLKAVRKNDREIAHYLVKELRAGQRSSHKW